jgi:hypothetical protein
MSEINQQAPQPIPVTVNMNNMEAQAALELIDMAVRAQGMNVAQAALRVSSLIQAAIIAAQSKVQQLEIPA